MKTVITVRIVKFVCMFFVLLLFNSTLRAEMFFPGEKLNYRVSYLGITLGYITIETPGHENLNKKEVIKTKGSMKSNPDIPFVDLQAVYESWIDPSGAFSHQFIGKVRLRDGSWDFHKIEFLYDKKKIRSQKFIRQKLFFDSTYYTDKKTSDGLSLFFLARRFTKLGKHIRIPTIVDRDTVFTLINFMNKKSKSEIKAVNHKIKTVYFSGKAYWTGIYGLTGGFEGWFSDDEASVPIRAKMEVYVGSIDIELVKWERGGWKPPKAE